MKKPKLSQLKINSLISKKRAELPKSPGVYFFKDKAGEIIYIGKAAVLKNRVNQYFQKSRARDQKTDLLISEIADLEYIEVETELDALFLEAELVRRYLPRYNILLRDDKSLVYVRINYSDSYPSISFTRRPLDDGAKYFGPYFSAFATKRALKYLRRAFPYSTHTGVIPKRVCLQYHLGLCPGLEENKTSLEEYRANLRKLIQYLRGERSKLMNSIEKQMRKAAARKDFELAAKYRNQLSAIKALSQRVVFSDKETLDIYKDQGLSGLTEILGLESIPRRIEGYDISHQQGTHNTASQVVFVNGLPDKAAYRKFKMRLPGNNDFAHMNETISRRLSPANTKKWGKPDLILIDGGKGQLSSAVKARDASGLDMPMIGLAKREEEIIVSSEGSRVALKLDLIAKQRGVVFSSEEFYRVLLPKNSPVVKLLQRIRDESHRFAVSYHSVLKTKAQTTSLLDGIPGVGPSTRSKLIRAFGSVSAVAQTTEAEIAAILGSKKAKQIHGYLSSDR
ncbi:MAG TPA: excinuclease ABC subunit UvrC [Candidatus Saccharimonadales bacterium]|nr:excinuclease ABC subunit UvrC [Candidatus Saccharimonadales bacterium]